MKAIKQCVAVYLVSAYCAAKNDSNMIKVRSLLTQQYKLCKNLMYWVLSIMPDRPVRDQWNSTRENGTTLLNRNKISNRTEAFHLVSTEISITSQ